MTPALLIGLGIAGAVAAAGLLLWRRRRRRAHEAAARALGAFLDDRPASMTEEQWTEFLLARLDGEERALPPGGPPIRSFRDLVAHPEVLRRACAVAWFDDAFHERMRRASSVAELTARLFEKKGLHEVIAELRTRDAAEVGEALKAAFADARFLEQAKDTVRGAGVVTAAQDLQARAAAPALAAIARTPAHVLAQDAVRALARIGDADSAAVVADALASPDDALAGAAVAGLDEPYRMVTRPRDAAFVDAVAEPLAAYVRAPRERSMSFLHPPAKILVRLCGSRAIPWLVAPEILRPGQPSLRDVLDALPPDAGPAAAAAVRSLFDALPPGDVRERAAALATLGRLGHPDAETLARAALAGTDPKLRTAGAAALCAARGLVEHPAEVVFGGGDLTPAQRLVAVALAYDGEVGNGGHDQYFFNSTGDDWRAAIEALEVLRATEHARCLREAVARFGAVPPPADCSARQDALAKLGDDTSSFDALDRRVWAASEELGTLVLLHVLEHPEGFERKG